MGGGSQVRIQVFIIEGEALYWRGVGGSPRSLAGPGQRPNGGGAQELNPFKAPGN